VHFNMINKKFRRGLCCAGEGGVIVMMWAVITK
jgi:hypothetical protein